MRFLRLKLPFSNISTSVYWGSENWNIIGWQKSISPVTKNRWPWNSSGILVGKAACFAYCVRQGKKIYTYCPPVAFSFRPSLAWAFEKTIVETEIVSNGILPAFFGFQLAVIWKLFRDIIVDSSKFQLAVWTILNCHGNHCYVTVRWLYTCIWNIKKVEWFVNKDNPNIRKI